MINIYASLVTSSLFEYGLTDLTEKNQKLQLKWKTGLKFHFHTPQTMPYTTVI